MGLTVSTTVTIAVQVDVFPQESAAIKFTLLAPTLPQLKTLLLKLSVLAVLPLSISATVKTTLPFLSKYKVAFLQRATGCGNTEI